MTVRENFDWKLYFISFQNLNRMFIWYYGTKFLAEREFASNDDTSKRLSVTR